MCVFVREVEPLLKDSYSCCPLSDLVKSFIKNPGDKSIKIVKNGHVTSDPRSVITSPLSGFQGRD